MIPAKKVAKKMLKFFEKEKDRKILKQALKNRNAESIYRDYDKEPNF